MHEFSERLAEKRRADWELEKEQRKRDRLDFEDRFFARLSNVFPRRQQAPGERSTEQQDTSSTNNSNDTE